MSVDVDVEGRVFSFDDSWLVSKYDDWAFHKNQMSLMHSKAVDLVAVGPGTTYLIEVKDYTHPETDRVPLDELPLTVAQKARDTLAGLWAASSVTAGHERETAQAALREGRVQVVLHVELSDTKGGALRNPQAVLGLLRSKLRSTVKAIDPHAAVSCHAQPHSLWESRRLRS